MLRHSTIVATADDGVSDVGTNEWNADHVVDGDGITCAVRTDNSDPAVPSANNLVLYGKQIGGRNLPKWMEPSGLDNVIQPHLGFNTWGLWVPGAGVLSTSNATSPAGAVIWAQGSVPVIYGVHGTSPTGLTQATPASTNILTQSRRTSMATGTGASGNGCFAIGNTLQFWRGNAAGLGGFFFMCRFAVPVWTTSTRVFVGLYNSVTVPSATLDYTTDTTAKVGMAISANTGNWRIASNPAATAPTLVDLGASFVAASTTNVYELVLFCKPFDTVVTYRVNILGTTTFATGSIANAALPSQTLFLTPRVHLTNNAAANTQLDFMKLYVETDY